MTESQSRNADFISIAREGNPPPSAPQALLPLERKRTQPFDKTCGGAAPLFLICGASRHHNPRPEGPSNLRTFRTLGAQPRQPSHRRCVQARRVLYLYSISSRVRASSTVSWPGALASFPAAKVRGAPRRFPATLVRTPEGPMPMVMMGVSGKR